LQNKAVKIISGAYWLASSQPIDKNLGILDFRNLLTFETAKFMFNFVEKGLPSTFDSYFLYTKDIRSRITRTSTKPYRLNILKYRTSRLQRSIKYRGVKTWNDIDSNLLTFLYHTFCKLYKKLLFDRIDNV